MKKPKLKFAVLGAGCGGQTFSGHLASLGFDVSLYNRSPERLGRLPDNHLISLEGAINAEGVINLATTDIQEAIKGRNIILIVTTANGHRDIARKIAPYISEGQIIILNPGRTFGALEVANEIYSQRKNLDIIICEANTLLYATRVLYPGKVKVYGVKEEISLAAIQPFDTQKVVGLMGNIFPCIHPAKNILETSLGNIGAVFHPTIMVFNYKKILNKEPFEFYCEGVNDEVAGFMEKIDLERITIADCLETEIPSIKEWLKNRYALEGKTLKGLLQNNPSYQGISAPTTLRHRYLLEDVPTGLVPLSLIGKALGLDTFCIDYLINEAEKITGKDLHTDARTLDRLGLNPKRIKKDLYDIIYSPYARAA